MRTIREMVILFGLLASIVVLASCDTRERTESNQPKSREILSHAQEQEIILTPDAITLVRNWEFSSGSGETIEKVFELGHEYSVKWSTLRATATKVHVVVDVFRIYPPRPGGFGSTELQAWELIFSVDAEAGEVQAIGLNDSVSAGKDDQPSGLGERLQALPLEADRTRAEIRAAWAKYNNSRAMDSAPVS